MESSRTLRVYPAKNLESNTLYSIENKRNTFSSGGLL
jgi:hypothetical protein